MTAAVLLDHVSAYAAAVRAHLADLSPEQVEDLTDGLEADLAEALEDPRGAVATGEIPIGRTGGAPGPESLIDLTQRFGSAADYAAELRAAAGVVARPSALTGAQQLARSVQGVRARGVARAHDLAARPAVAGAAGFAVALRPVWWLARGWVWFVLVIWALRGILGFTLDQGFVPETAGAWLLLVATVVASVQWGRGRLARPVVLHWAALGGNVIAVVLVVPLALATWTFVTDKVSTSPTVSYVEVPVYEPAPEQDGVWVDGVQVSNLFVYDAQGEPLSDVQVFDDRGRQVRTTNGDPWATWSLPGVSEQWRFTPARDDAGRELWNVYPLLGASVDDWDEAGEQPVLPPEASPVQPPAPFAKAPAVASGPEAPGPGTGSAGSEGAESDTPSAPSP